MIGVRSIPAALSMHFLPVPNYGILSNLLKVGTPETNRTSDLPLRRGLLYPLSYRGVGVILAHAGQNHVRMKAEG